MTITSMSDFILGCFVGVIVALIVIGLGCAAYLWAKGRKAAWLARHSVNQSVRRDQRMWCEGVLAEPWNYSAKTIARARTTLKVIDRQELASSTMWENNIHAKKVQQSTRNT